MNVLTKTFHSQDVWLVTGACGFLGGHVCELLSQGGQKIIALDNLAWPNKKTYEKLQADQNITFIKEDIRHSDKLKDLLNIHRPRFVIHLAAMHFIPTASQFPSEAMSINVVGTQSLLEAIRKSEHPPDCFWFASTGDVYAPVDTTLDEDTTPTGPFNTYGLSKLMGEQMIDLEVKFNLKTRFVIGRLFNLYGTGETNPHIIPEIMKQIKTQKNYVKLGNTWPTRDMLPVRDAALALILMSLNWSSLKGTVSKINVGTGRSYSIQELVDFIGQALGQKIEVIADLEKIRPVERAHLKANIKKLVDYINFSPSSDLKKGIADLLREELS